MTSVATVLVMHHPELLIRIVIANDDTASLVIGTFQPPCPQKPIDNVPAACRVHERDAGRQRLRAGGRAQCAAATATTTDPGTSRVVVAGVDGAGGADRLQTDTVRGLGGQHLDLQAHVGAGGHAHVAAGDPDRRAADRRAAGLRRQRRCQRASRCHRRASPGSRRSPGRLPSSERCTPAVPAGHTGQVVDADGCRCLPRRDDPRQPSRTPSSASTNCHSDPGWVDTGPAGGRTTVGGETVRRRRCRRRRCRGRRRPCGGVRHAAVGLGRRLAGACSR